MMTNLKQASIIAYKGARLLGVGAAFAWRVFSDLSRLLGAAASAQLAALQQQHGDGRIATSMAAVAIKRSHFEKPYSKKHKAPKPAFSGPAISAKDAAVPVEPVKPCDEHEQPEQGHVVPLLGLKHGACTRHLVPNSRPRRGELGLPACMAPARERGTRAAASASCRQQQASALKMGLARNRICNSKAHQHLNKLKKQPKGHMH